MMNVRKRRAEAEAPESLLAAPTTEKRSLSSSTRSSRRHSIGMESSVLRFRNISFTVEINKGKKKKILSNISGRVKWGHVLAVMGPSGAGKTTLINVLTLNGLHGKATGSVTVNGVRMSSQLFKNHCYVVPQRDRHWPYLTCRETVLYGAESYAVSDISRDRELIVDDILAKMGLTGCKDTRCCRLSGGQLRRLSIAMALLKQPALLFLDEPTSGLDAAAAANIMQCLVRVAKEERLIILCTIHQPSTKVYNGFDEVMLLSKGREAFTGNVSEAAPYFESIGHPLPLHTNPAEHFLDLVNSDFSDEQKVDEILDAWDKRKQLVEADSSDPELGVSGHDDVDCDGQTGVTEIHRLTAWQKCSILLRRHATLIVRDPLLYIGRSLAFLVTNTLFSLVYLQSRPYDQEFAVNKLWVTLWHAGIATNLGAVAVYALNSEFQVIKSEAKNGMTSPVIYALIKSALVVPIFFLFAFVALTIPAIAIMDFPVQSLGSAVVLWAAFISVYESVAECLAVWIVDPIVGMLTFMSFWFGSLVFGGFLVPLDTMYWPFKLFYYVMPLSYYLRSQMYVYLHDSLWTPCDPLHNVQNSAVCVPAPATGDEILTELTKIFPVLEAHNTYSTDLGAIVAIALFFKLLFLLGVMHKGSLAASIQKEGEDEGAGTSERDSATVEEDDDCSRFSI